MAFPLGVWRRAQLVAGDLADHLAVSRQTISSIETGKYDPSLPLAIKIARLFGLAVEQIFLADEPVAEPVD